MAETPKPSLMVVPTTRASAPDLVAHIANGAQGVVHTIVVSTRDFRHDQSVYLLTPSEFDRLPMKRSALTGAMLVIDAQPLYDSGRVFSTFNTDRVLRLARAVLQEFGAVLQHLCVICDAPERDSIYSQLTLGMDIPAMAAERGIKASVVTDDAGDGAWMMERDPDGGTVQDDGPPAGIRRVGPPADSYYAPKEKHWEAARDGLEPKPGSLGTGSRGSARRDAATQSLDQGIFSGPNFPLFHSIFF